MGNPRHRWMCRSALVAVALLLPLAACASDGGSDASSAEPGEATTTAAPPEPLHILVSNDDGYDAPGIDALVEGLATLEAVEITVVAPLDQRSGTGGQETEGAVATSEVQTLSGHPATAVDGFPSDTIRVAIDEQGLEPDLVITGINAGQNLGPLVDVSGTVGAARAAVARGIPALATSQGTAGELDYDAAVPMILDWVEAHRASLLAGDAAVDVTNLNVPSCTEGEVRGLLEVPADLDGDVAAALAGQDCTSTVEEGSLDGDVVAFTNGFATIDVLAATPGG